MGQRVKKIEKNLLKTCVGSKALSIWIPKITWAWLREDLVDLLYVNNKHADQPAHPCSLVSTFVVHFLEYVI